MYEVAGGDVAFVTFATALHDRCLGDPVLFHPFSQTSDPDHVEHLASYLAEVFGGPTTYSAIYGGHSAMLEVGRDRRVSGDGGPLRLVLRPCAG